MHLHFISVRSMIYLFSASLWINQTTFVSKGNLFPRRQKFLISIIYLRDLHSAECREDPGALTHRRSRLGLLGGGGTFTFIYLRTRIQNR
jgi:hypothetical protein